MKNTYKGVTTLPIKGMLLIFAIAIGCAIIYRNQIYKWLTSEFFNKNDDDINDSNFEEEQ